MHALGDISAAYGLPLQSHLSESPAEIEWVKALHPDCSSYGDVYLKHQLLHPYAYMAHCCHSDTEERDLLRRTGTGVVHCPSSNFMLGSGVLDVRGLVNEGIKVALGTDVAGGYSPSMLDAVRQTIIASRIKEMQHRDANAAAAAANAAKAAAVAAAAEDDESNPKRRKRGAEPGVEADADAAMDDADDENDAPVTSPAPYTSLSVKEAFHLATVGGAEVLGMGRVLGNFMAGKKLDCLVVDVNMGRPRSNSMNDLLTNPSDASGGYFVAAPVAEESLSLDASCDAGAWVHDYGLSPVDTFDNDGLMERFEKFLFLGDDRNLAAIYVDGRCVLSSNIPLRAKM